LARGLQIKEMLMNMRTAGLSFMLALAVVAGYGGGGSNDNNADLPPVQSVAPVGQVQEPPPGEIVLPVEIRAEGDMVSGRLSKVPVSVVYVATVQLTGEHRAAFRSVCSDADTAANRCNTGMIVTSSLETRFNDNSPDAQRFATGPKGSSITLPESSATRSYTVIVFSMARATSRTRIDYSASAGETWQRLSGTNALEVGGTLLNVGPLSLGDYLEVRTRSNGAGDNDTRMFLVSPADPTRAALSSNNPSGAERDPRITISGAAWPDPGNLMLVCKTGTSTATNKGVETRVDIVRGPTVERSVSLGSATTLDPGRYLVSLFATVEMPVGAYSKTDPSSWNPAGQMPVLQNAGCPRDGSYGLDDSTWYRGQPNDFALRMVVQRWSERTQGWTDWITRRIPRGAFGAASGAGWNKFAVELKVDEPGRYRVLAEQMVAGIRLFQDWRHERNPQATQLKAVSYNTYYAEHSFDQNKYKNVANLLGTLGSIVKAEQRVEEPQDQAPWQWDADIIGLQEVRRDGSLYIDVVKSELEARGSMLWSYVQGMGERWNFSRFTDGPGMSPVFVNEHFFPGTTPASILFSSASKLAADCESGYSVGNSPSNWTQCHLSERGIGDGEIYNFAIAGKASVWRGSAVEDRPIAVFNVHLEASDGPADFGPRVGELQSLIEKIDRFLVADHRAFNRAGAGDPDRSHPQHYQNRALIIGDWNVRAHECGEHLWMIRRLREHYGYAVDVAMAVADSRGSLIQGSHMGAESGYVSGVPRGYQHFSVSDPRSSKAWRAWQDAPNFVDSAYPWWSVDYRGKTSGFTSPAERLSLIVLVGRGWAYDDPTLEYAAMADSTHVSPSNPVGRGVEMWRPDDCNDAGSVPSAATGYRPNYSLGCDSSPHGGTRPGASALHSDHRPILARLRVWTR
jgi:hypothetical protein